MDCSPSTLMNLPLPPLAFWQRTLYTQNPALPHGDVRRWCLSESLLRPPSRAHPVRSPRKTRLGSLENPGWAIVENGKVQRCLLLKELERCASIIARSATPKLLLATERWHCQGFLAFPGSSPPSAGTARDSWRGAGFRHPGLALPGISGVPGVLATQLWHCQGFLARGRHPARSSALSTYQFPVDM